MGVSSPTGNGETRGMEWAGLPGTPLASRPARAAANNAASVGYHSTDSDSADSASTQMKRDLAFGKKSVPDACHDTDNSRAADGNTDMKAKAIR